MNRRDEWLARQQGVGMIEVLITLVVLGVGLLGLAGLQAKANVTQLESYQRSQALSFMSDMEERLTLVGKNLNALKDDLYQFTSDDGSLFFGEGDFFDRKNKACADYLAPDVNEPNSYSVCEWSLALRGQGELKNGQEVGAIPGARGCLITPADPAPNSVAEFFVVVVWRGLAPGPVPPTASPGALCADGQDFGDTGSKETTYKRSVSTRVVIPKFAG